MVLEPPSEATLKAKELTEEQSLHPSAPEFATVPQDKPVPKKRKGPKGPNPLSVKKKKNPNPAASARPSQKTKAEPSDAPLSTTELPGQKRKRDSQDDKSEEQIVKMTDTAQGITSNRTRKRRRKALAIPPSPQ
jgi:U3 small nucleolar RNA-associated protein 23